MSDPLRRFKFLPWQSLLQAAFLTLCFVLAVEFLVSLGSSVPEIARLLVTLFNPPLGIIVSYVIAFGVGALAVAILERLNRPAINTASLWGLILCVAIAFLVRRLLPLPAILFEFGSVPLTVMMLGVFWRGQPYWRSFRRW